MRTNNQKALHKGVALIGVLLNEQEEKVLDAIEKALSDHDSDKEFKFGLTCAISLVPRGQTTAVSAKLGYSLKMSCETDPVEVDDQEDLFDAISDEQRVINIICRDQLESFNGYQIRQELGWSSLHVEQVLERMVRLDLIRYDEATKGNYKPMTIGG